VKNLCKKGHAARRMDGEQAYALQPALKMARRRGKYLGMSSSELTNFTLELVPAIAIAVLAFARMRGVVFSQLHHMPLPKLVVVEI